MNVFLDDIRPLPDNYIGEWMIVRRVDEVQKLLREGKVEALSLDHDLGLDQPTGYNLVCWMERENIWPSGMISVHSANPVGAANMRRALKANGK